MSYLQELIDKTSVKGETVVNETVVSDEALVPNETVETPAQVINEVVDVPEPIQSEAVEEVEESVRVVRLSQEEPVSNPQGEVKEDLIPKAEFEKLKAQLEEVNQSKYADERVAKIDEYIRNGGELNEQFWRYQSMDFNNVELDNASQAADLIKQDLIDIQGYTSAQAEMVIRRKYPNLYNGVDEYASEEDKMKYDDDVLQIGIDAKQAVNNLKQYQEKIMLPKGNTAPKVDTVAQQKAFEKFKQDAESKLQEFTKLDLEVNKEIKLEIPVTAESMGYVKGVVSDPSRLDNYWTDNFVKNGEVDFIGIAKQIYLRDNWESLLKSAVNQGIEIGKEKAIKESGIEPTLKGGVPKVTSSNPIAQGWLSQIRK